MIFSASLGLSLFPSAKFTLNQAGGDRQAPKYLISLEGVSVLCSHQWLDRAEALWGWMCCTLSPALLAGTQSEPGMSPWDESLPPVGLGASLGEGFTN